MGIHDRDYYDDRRRSAGAGGLGRVSFRPRELSINSWLIIINVAVFILNASLPLVNIQDGTQKPGGIAADVIERAVPSEVQRPPNIPEGRTWLVPYVDPATGREIIGVTEDGRPAPYADVYRTWHPLNGWGHFSLLKGFLAFEVWRVVTFQFLHANITHLFFNMFGLFIFGGMVEQYLGRRKYLAYYLICGIGGGLLYLLFAGLNALQIPLPGTLSMTSMATPLIGASAGVFGVIVACARLAPDMRVMLLFPPIPLKMKWLAYGYVGIAAFNLITGGSNAGGDAAHIGGAIAGFYFIRNQHLLRGFLDFGIGPAAKGPRRSGRQRSVKRDDIDRILAKVNDKGLHSLTSREKKALERASREARDGS